ncbi:MAG: ABC transporter permease, partial [Acidobacteria bacterium]|nr:ABC transporter permease [Acidobacteriota bacterium]
MSIGDSFRLAIDTLLAHKLRSFLTLLGILISVTTLVTVVSIVRGMDQFVAERLSQLGTEVFVISRFGMITNAKQWAEAQKRPRLTLQDYEALRRGVTQATHVGAIVRERGELKHGRQSLRAAVRGVTANMIDIRTEELATGRYISEADYRHRKQVCVIGADVLKNLYPSGNAVGKLLSIRGQRFQVVGVAEPVGSIFGQSQDNFVYIPLTTALKLYGRRRSIGFQIRVREAALLPAATDQARLILRTRHHLDYFDKDDFGLISPAAVLELWQSLTGTIARTAVVVTIIFVVMGGIVIMNIMLASLTERTWEVGMRKAVGATRADVRMQFLMEAACLSTLGGVLGVALSFA